MFESFFKPVPVSLPLSMGHFVAIGHVMAQWAFLESEIDTELSWLLSRARHKRESINFRARFSTRAAHWIRLATPVLKRADEMRDVNRIAGRAVTIKAERDFLAHGRYVGGPDRVLLLVMRAGGITDTIDHLGTADEINDLAFRISAINKEMWELRAKLDKRYRKRP
jgi:hypothetical protein